MRKDFNTKKANDVKLDFVAEIHAISGLLKQYLRELPDPVFPVEMYPLWLTGISKTNRESLTQFFREYCSQLPPLNQSVLRHILPLLYFISSNSDINQMTANNLSIVMSPNIIRAPNTLPQDKIMQHTAIHTSLFSKMISYAPDFFEDLSQEKEPTPLLDHFLSQTALMPTAGPIPYVEKEKHQTTQNPQIQNTQSTNNNEPALLDFADISLPNDPSSSDQKTLNVFEDASSNDSREGGNGRSRAVALKQSSELVFLNPPLKAEPQLSLNQKTSSEITTEQKQSEPEAMDHHQHFQQPPQYFGKCLALFDFEATESSELSFKNGDLLLILSDLKTQQLDEWWEAKHSETKQTGQIPRTYVKRFD